MRTKGNRLLWSRLPVLEGHFSLLLLQTYESSLHSSGQCLQSHNGEGCRTGTNSPSDEWSLSCVRLWTRGIAAFKWDPAHALHHSHHLLTIHPSHLIQPQSVHTPSPCKQVYTLLQTAGQRWNAKRRALQPEEPRTIILPKTPWKQTWCYLTAVWELNSTEMAKYTCREGQLWTLVTAEETQAKIESQTASCRFWSALGRVSGPLLWPLESRK